ncbi:MAG: UDP-N-acetylmuramate dehydrogenase [Gammaproteobacteria bacterium]|nr:UDP-N-acetylmuramate dehydrogenase [Gammaproteobacteria bacterium]
MLKCVNMKSDLDNITIVNNEAMSGHTSWRTGGVARQYVQAGSLSALAAFIATLPENENILWMGLGSNTLVRDGGFNGTVIATQGVMSQLAIVDESGIDETTVYVGAGVAGAKLARFCSKHKLTGAEFFAGIPGLLGGALAMNAGAFGGETWPLVVEVETLNRKGEITKRKASEFKYSYRHVEAVKDEWFVSATLKLKKQQDNNNTIDIKQLLARRAEAQPTGVASCGSVFRNPEGHYAAQLIEQCGLKGKFIGGAVISEKHANFIINDNNATATDIESLIKLIQKTVKHKYGILLQPEVKIVGEFLSGEGQ